MTFATSAAATIRQDPVRIRRVGQPPVLVPGQPAVLHLELAAARDVTVTGLEFFSPALAAASKTAGPLPLAAGGAVPIRLELLPGESPEPLVVRFEVDGRPVEQTMDLLPLLASEREKRAAVIQVKEDAGVPPTPRFPVKDVPPPLHDEGPDRESGLTENDTLAPAGVERNIRVRGRFAYYRSDGALMGADRIWVRVMDEDTGPDDVLASFHADSFGYFDVTFYWDPGIGEGNPDLYVKFEAEHSSITVQSAGFEIDYSWETSTIGEFSGDHLNLGTLAPSDEGTFGALHIFTNVIRAYAWYDNYAGYSVPSVDVQWPDGATGAFYNRYWEEIHVGTDRTWREDTHTHELGHHFVNNFAADGDIEYCNGNCDEGSCGHCLWCEETANIAFSEGWPNWIAHVQTSSYLADYGTAAQFTRDQESVQTCDGTLFHNVFATEGFIGAILQDIWDSAQDQDPNRLGERDALALGHDEIFHVLTANEPQTPFAFLNSFKVRYPQHAPGLWQTALNNRWQLDTQNPSPVTGLASTTHTVGVPSLNNQIIITWNGCTDDWSGLSGYQFIIDRPAPQPDTTFILTTSPIAGTYPLPAGTYTLRVRAMDRSGKLGTQASIGPFVINAPIGADLTWTQPAGWARPLVARPFDNSTSNSVPDPFLLTGDAAATYLNFACLNAGDQTYTFPPTLPALSAFVVDGAIQGPLWPTYDPGPGQVQMTLNMGPYTIRGGRHTIGMRLDWMNRWYESNEANNLWGHQWVWSPLGLSPNVPVRRAAPPNATGGWNTVLDGSPVFPNCDGLRFLGNAQWTAVWIAADSDTADYDCRIHDVAAGPTSGFDVHRGTSTREAGCLDLVVVHRYDLGFNEWDVGVSQDASDAAPYVATMIQSRFLSFNVSEPANLADSSYARLYDLNLSSAQLGLKTVEVTGDPADGPYYLAWLDRTLVWGGLDTITRVASDSTGRARINVNVTTAGGYGVLIFRDPRDGRSARNLALIVKPTPPDLMVVEAPGWHAPLVPRPAADGTPSSVPLPATLAGEAASTFLNWLGRNASPVAVPDGIAIQVYRDGLPLATASTPPLAPNADFLSNQTTPVTVPGGRHTLSLVYDPAGVLDELEETNNTWGEQFVWTPIPLTSGQAMSRPAPPPATGGWEHIPSGEPRLLNCDGLRVPVLANGPAQWGGVAVLPAPGDNIDLLLYEIATDTKIGFVNALTVSGALPGEIDYVLADFQATPRREFDAGVVNVNGGAGSYTIQAATGELLELPTGLTGPFTLEAGQVVAVHEAQLAAGVYHIRLNNTGTVDLGISAHAPGSPAQARGDAVMAAWVDGPGADEEFDLEVPAAGTWAFPVWRAGAADLASAASYELEITSTVTAAPDGGLPAITRLTRIGPNPFAGSAGISYELSESEPVTIAVYDILGARVRTLAEGHRNAGRHEVVWTGDGDNGRSVPAGIYFVSLQTRFQRLTGRLVKVR